MEEDEIGGYRIPAGKIVMVCQWVTHRRPDLWERPDDFVPERFVGAGPGTFPPFAYYPFGGGRAAVHRQPLRAHGGAGDPGHAGPALRRRSWSRGRTVLPDATFTLRPKHGIRMRIRRRTPVAETAPAREPVPA